MLEINYLAVLTAALAAFIIGFLFHGPIFGKLWMRLANIVPTGKEKMSDMYGKMFWNYVVNFITAYALAVVYSITSGSVFMGKSNIYNGIICALLAWAGFIATSTSIEVIWMGKPFKLWLFEFFSSLIAMITMGLIIAGWSY